jgi:FkbM family methyltransferase
MNKILNRIRYNYYVSLLLSWSIKPIYIVLRYILTEIEKKIWVNGRKVSYDNLKIVFPKNIGVPYSSSIFWKSIDGFEPENYKVLKEFFNKSDYFLDIGSNIGWYSVLAKKINPDIEVYAYEPILEIFNKNQHFHRVNKIKNKLNNIAVSSINGEAEIILPVTSYIEEETTATLSHDSWQANTRNKKYVVETKSLDTIIDKIKLRKNARIVIKIDVEDFEADVIKGGRAVINQFQPIIVCEILFRKHGNKQMLLELQKINYLAYGITRDGLFRMNDFDFQKPRKFNDFLLIPNTSGVSPNYLRLADLEKLGLNNQM